MRCFIDTNILVSAGLFPTSVPAAALEKALSPPHTAIICDYTLDEVRSVINRKFPHKARDLDLFLSRLLNSIEYVPTPRDVHDSESEIRDIKDRPLLRAAINAQADILITGDKDFIESTITNPQIVTAADFVRMF